MWRLALYMHKDSEVIFEWRRNKAYAVLAWWESMGPLASQRFQKINSQRVSYPNSGEKVFFLRLFS